MKRSPTMKDVAQAAGVSVMTVSRAFKRDASVNADTRKRITETADRLGYVFDSMAANLRSQRSHFVAVTIPSLNNADFAETTEALAGQMAGTGYQLLIGYTNYDMRREEELIAEFLRRRPEAIVVTGGRHTSKTRRMLKSSGVPVIETWDLPAEPIDNVAGFSNAAAIEPLVDHLTASGFERIAFIGGETEGDSRGADRRRGFVAAMQARGLDATRLVPIGPPPISMREGAVAMAKLLDAGDDTQAVIAVSDLAAFGALTECQRRGIPVPDRIAIAGFGAYDIAAISVPTITTIDPKASEIGTLAGQMILSLLEPVKVASPIARQAQISPVLKIGQSTMRNPER